MGILQLKETILGPLPQCGFLDFKTKLLILKFVRVRRETEVKTFGEL